MVHNLEMLEKSTGDRFMYGLEAWSIIYVTSKARP